MKKLNDLQAHNCIEAYGFPAIVDYALKSNPEGQKVIVSTLPPAAMLEMGIAEYYAPILPRGAKYATADDVLSADLNVNHITISSAEGVDTSDLVIVSGRPGTAEMLQKLYPDARVLSGIVSPEDISDHVVVGTLPTHLAAWCKAYIAVNVDGWDAAREGDVSGEELRRRVRVYDPVTVRID